MIVPATSLTMPCGSYVGCMRHVGGSFDGHADARRNSAKVSNRSTTKDAREAMTLADGDDGVDDAAIVFVLSASLVVLLLLRLL